MIKAVFFDLDDTLYPYTDSNAKIQSELEAIQHFCQKYPKCKFLEALALYNKTRKDIKKKYACFPARDNRELWFLEFMQHEGIFDKKMLREMEEIYWNCVEKNAVPYYDATLILPYLAKRYVLCLVTNGLKKIQEGKLQALQLLSFFSHVITSSEAGFDKPHKDVFLLAMKRAGVTAREAAMVGDNPYADIFPANRLHMKTFWLRRGQRFYYPIMGKLKPTHTITNFLELKQWL